MEDLLEQERALEVRAFLDSSLSDQFFLTDFAFHSISIALIKLKKNETLIRFVNDVFIDGSVQVIHLPVEDTAEIINVITRYNLDFDDAYQYTASEKYDLQIISFDTDFDRTERGRKTPAQILNKKEG